MPEKNNAELQAAKAALEASERRYRELVDLAPIGIFRSTLEGRFVSVNPALVSLLGYDSPDEMLRLDLGADVYVDGAERDRRMREVEITGRSGFEVRWKRRDGSPVWVLLDSRVIRGGSGAIEQFEGFVHDIQKRKDAEEALREKAHLLSESQRIARIGSWLYDMSGRITWSAEMYRIFGVSSDTFTPNRESFLDLIHPEDRAVMREWLATCAAVGKPGDQEFRHILPDGAVRFVRGRGELVCDAEGRPDHMAGTAQDVTERTQMEKERRQLEEKLRQSQKMEAVGQLAGGVAHDFNNVLTAILGYGSLLASRLAPDAPGREEVDEILHASERAAALTRQLLAFSRRQVLKPVVLSINELIANFEKMLGRLIGEDVNLIARLDPSLGNVRADRGQLEQVIMNLAVNARDAMPDGGRLTIETANADLDESYAQQHVPVEPGRYVMVALSDTGSGMDEETQARIFEPFFTTKEKGKGTGLGLATVYGIVKQSGGYIWVYSEPGKGTTFKVYLPRAEEAAAESAPPPSDSLPRVGIETILLVEDEPAVRNLSRRVLEERGYRVLEASSGKEALERIRGEEGRIHLLLTDLVMPEMGGTELASRLEVEDPTMRVLFMSGYTDDAVVRNGLLGSGRAFLQKPFTPAMLVRKIRDVLA